MTGIRRRRIALAVLMLLGPLSAQAWSPATPGQRVGPESGYYSAVMPAGWTIETKFSTLVATFNGPLLGTVTMREARYGAVFGSLKPTLAADAPLEALAARYVASVRAAVKPVELSVLETGETVIADRPWFRVHLRYRLPQDAGGVLIEEVTVGAPLKTVVTLVSLRAPALHFFALRSPEFEALLPSIAFAAPPAPSQTR